MIRLPVRGLEADAVFERLETYRKKDVDWRSGRTYAYVYDAGRDVEAVGKKAFTSFITENAIDPTAFPSLLRLESDLVGLVAGHLRGDERVVGNFTSGGTESIILAVKAAREHARRTRPEVTAPEIVLPTTAHAAFHKGAEYLGLKVVLVDVDATFRADPAAMAAAITPSTIMIVGSAPSYAHAVVDPIAALSDLAKARGIWLHVDACVGGWLLPFWRRLGAKVPEFDFALPGVSSISVDLHKYAFVPKGASLVLFRDKALRRNAIFACNEWTGYSVINPTVQSSRSGGPLAAAWSVLHRLGDEGYLDLARQTLDGTRRLVAGVRQIPGLQVVVDPDFCLLSVTSTEVGVFHVIDEMNARGWYLQPQLAYRNSPASIHLSLSPANAAHVDRMLEDLRASVEAARKLPFGHLAAMIQGALQSGALGDLSSPEAVGKLMAMGGLDGTSLPTRMAGVHEMLGALPRELAREILIEFVNDLYTPTREAAPARELVAAGA